jgi:glycosyltransferase involved in cell wall biosynthesis
MLLSIILTTYNSEKFYLTRAWESLRIDVEYDLEIIIIDDGSSYLNVKLLESLVCKKNISNVRLIKKKTSSGLSDSRNLGLINSSGMYICFLDDDDEICLESSLSVLENLDLNYDIVEFAVEYPTSEPTISTIFKTDSFSAKSKKEVEAYFVRNLRRNTYLAPAPYRIYRRDFILINELFFQKGIIHEDEEWTPKVFLSANSLLSVTNVHYKHYFDRSDSITRSVSKESRAFRANSLKIICDTYLQKEYSAILNLYMHDYFANLYMQIPLHDPDIKINSVLPLLHSYKFKTRIKSLFFLLGNKNYLKVIRFLNNISPH